MRSSFKTTVSLLCIEASFALVFETWTSANYLGALAGKIGVGVGFVTLLGLAPWIGSLVQLASMRFAAKAPSLKTYTLGVSWIARAVWLIPLVALGLLTLSSKQPNMTLWFGIVSATAMVSWILLSTGAVGWNAWVRTLIPSYVHGRFFGLRQRHIMIALITANVVAGFLLDITASQPKLGYSIILSLGCLCGLASAHVLSKVPDSFTTSIHAPSSFKSTFRNQAFMRAIRFSASFNGAVFFCSPYFSYHFSKHLGVNVGTIAIWSGITSLGSFLAAKYWAHKLDHSSSVVPLLQRAGVLVALSPLAYLFANEHTIYYIAPMEYFINGIAWSGYLLSVNATLHRVIPRSNSTAYFSVYTASHGIAGAIGTMVGGKIADMLGSRYHLLWILGSALRFGCLWFFSRKIERSRAPIVSPHQHTDKQVASNPLENAVRDELES